MDSFLLFPVECITSDAECTLGKDRNDHEGPAWFLEGQVSTKLWGLLVVGAPSCHATLGAAALPGAY
jgi:hypothetical protein